jgi:transcriptional regulator with XRE-family HTH domain
MPARANVHARAFCGASVHIAMSPEPSHFRGVEPHRARKQRTTPEQRKAVGERIRARRVQRGWEQAELADRVGTRGHSMWRYEAGRTMPGPDMIDRIAEALGVTSRVLLRGDDAPAPVDPSALDDPPYPAWRVFLETLPALGVTVTAAELAELKTWRWKHGAPTGRTYLLALETLRSTVPAADLEEGHRVSEADRARALAKGAVPRKPKRR